MKKITVTDYTIEQLEYEGKKLLFREKTALVKCLDKIGFDVIELPPIKKKREDTVVYKTISKTVKNAAVSIKVNPSEVGITEAYEAICEAANPIMCIELPVSTLAMEYSYHIKSDKMLLFAQKLVSFAASLCKNVEFSALDAFGADREFLIEILKTAEKAGASSLCICDGREPSLPEEIEETVKIIKSEISVPLSIKVYDKTAMATALALYAVKGGVDGIKCAVSGKNTLCVEKLDYLLKQYGEKSGVFSGLEDTHVHSDVRKLLGELGKASREEVNNAGKLSFDVHTTPQETSEAARNMGYSLTEEEEKNIYMALISLCGKKGTIEQREFEALIVSNSSQAPAVYILESYNISASNLSSSMASVVLVRNGEKITGLSTGDGPIDAAFHAIENALGFHYYLDDFQIQAVTEGKEALGSALVKLRSDGEVFAGNGLSADIVGASVAAYINAVNKIVYREDGES